MGLLALGGLGALGAHVYAGMNKTPAPTPAAPTPAPTAVALASDGARTLSAALFPIVLFII